MVKCEIFSENEVIDSPSMNLFKYLYVLIDHTQI